MPGGDYRKNNKRKDIKPEVFCEPKLMQCVSNRNWCAFDHSVNNTAGRNGYTTIEHPVKRFPRIISYLIFHHHKPFSTAHVYIHSAELMRFCHEHACSIKRWWWTFVNKVGLVVKIRIMHIHIYIYTIYMLFRAIINENTRFLFFYLLRLCFLPRKLGTSVLKGSCKEYRYNIFVCSILECKHCEYLKNNYSVM